jgi:hypothetical protein
MLVARRLVVAVPVLIGVSVIVFLMMRLRPGDVAQLILSDWGASRDQVEQRREHLGLNDPLVVQYAHFVGRALRESAWHGWRADAVTATRAPSQHEAAKRSSGTTPLPFDFVVRRHLVSNGSRSALRVRDAPLLRTRADRRPRPAALARPGSACTRDWSPPGKPRIVQG